MLKTSYRYRFSNYSALLNMCPNCGGTPKIHTRRNKYYIECDGDCWTQTDKHVNLSDAIDAWNNKKSSEEEDYDGGG